MRLKDKVSLITGAASGIGRATAILFAKEGAKVVVADYDEQGGNQTVDLIRQVGGEAFFIHADVSIALDSENVIKTIILNFGKLDILFNNAGISLTGKVADTTEKEWDKIIDTNLKGVFLLSKYAIPEMLKNGKGVIINMASALGFVGMENLSAYCASKGGVVALTKAMALDYAPIIRINCLCPGAISTPMMEHAFNASKDPDAMRNAYIMRHPIGRLGTPEDVAQAALYLASEESSFITGSSLIIDGGATAK